MEYLIGLLLSLAVAGVANRIGFDRDPSSLSHVLIVIASYYVKSQYGNSISHFG